MPFQPLREGTDLRGNGRQAGLDRGIQGVAVGLGPGCGEPDQVRAQLGDQPRQLSLPVSARFAKGDPGRQVERWLARPDQDEFEPVGRRGEGRGPHGGRPLVVRQRAEDSDAQPLAGRGAADRDLPFRLGHLVVRHDQGAGTDAVARQAPLHVAAGAEDAIRLREQPAVLPAPGHDVARGGLWRTGDAGVATGLVRLRAVPPGRLRHQVDAWADAEIVVHRDVEGHAQQVDEATHIHAVAVDMVDMGAADAAVPEQGGEVLDLIPRQPQHWMTGHGRHRQLATRRCRPEDEVLSLAGRALDQLLHVPLCPAAQGMADQQDHRALAVPEQLRRCREPGGCRRVELDVPAHAFQVVGMPREDQLPGSVAQGRVLAEAHLARMVNEGVAGQQMGPALRGGPQAEVVLLAIAAPEGLGIKEADGVEAVAPDVHGEADGGRQIRRAAGIGPFEGGIQRRGLEPQGQRPALHRGVAADRRVVGEWRDGADALPGMGMRHQPASQPCGTSVSLFRSTIVLPSRLHAAVHAANEAQILRVAQQPDAAGSRHLVEPAGQFRLRRAVVQHDDVAARTRRSARTLSRQRRVSSSPR